MKFLIITFLILFTFLSTSAVAEIKFSGFGSIIAGKTLGTVDDPFNPGTKRDEILTADFYDVGQYTNDITFKAESIFALQAVMDLSTNFKATAQLVAKGVDDFEPEFDWYYLTYQATDSLTFIAGRRNIPMYYFSEFSEVGYAYPWMRPPSNLYWWQVTQFNGVHAMYDFDWGDSSNSITAFYGNEYSDDNKEMGYYEVLFGGEDSTVVDEYWTDIMGVNWAISGDWSDNIAYDLRFVYFQHDMERTRHVVNANDTTLFTSQQFLGFGGSVDISTFTVLFDFNFVTRDDGLGTEYPTYLLSVVYNHDEFHPYLTYSKADHERTEAIPPTEDLEEHYIASIGLRYDFLPTASFKIQYDTFDDQGGPGWAYHGDSDTISMGVDFIF
jgi:hypothetical protein